MIALKISLHILTIYKKAVCYGKFLFQVIDSFNLSTGWIKVGNLILKFKGYRWLKLYCGYKIYKALYD